MIRRQVVAAFLSIVGTVGPAAAAPPPKAVPKKPLFFPVEVGAKWVYDYGSDDVTFVVSKVEKSDKGTHVTTEAVDADGKRTHSATYLVSEAGLWMTHEVNKEYTPAWPLLKAADKAGEKWDLDINRKALQIYGTCTLGDDEPVTVAAGKYTARKVVCTDYKIGPRRGGGETETNWYAPGVGEVHRVSGDGKTIRTLKSFTPGKN